MAGEFSRRDGLIVGYRSGFGFRPTGHPAIDRLLSAVSIAGSGYDATLAWTTPREPHEAFSGTCYAEWIQHAADDAAATLGKP